MPSISEIIGFTVATVASAALIAWFGYRLCMYRLPPPAEDPEQAALVAAPVVPNNGIRHMAHGAIDGGDHPEPGPADVNVEE